MRCPGVLHALRTRETLAVVAGHEASAPRPFRPNRKTALATGQRHESKGCVSSLYLFQVAPQTGYCPPVCHAAALPPLPFACSVLSSPAQLRRCHAHNGQ